MSATRPDSQLQYSPKASEIIRRTNELLASGGYNGFSYADIAELVDVRKASIHHHFPAKADLVKATVALHRDATRRGLQSLDQLIPDPLERLVLSFLGGMYPGVKSSNLHLRPAGGRLFLPRSRMRSKDISETSMPGLP